MAAPAEIVRDYLDKHETLDTLRFITCGSVDDGKSTLIGRLLFDTRALFEDQLAALEKDSARHGTQGDAIDYALLMDGLSAEREQGITIDVAYRFFGTQKRRFIVADCPGHEQYTRNMATGASTADLAVVLVDARKGVLTQTRRHSYIAALWGIRHIVLAVNKMDLVGYEQSVFDGICAEYAELATQLGLKSVQCIPVSALQGENVLARGTRMPWYEGPALLTHLESVPVREEEIAAPFRLPVQWVCRPHQDFRGFAGTVASGRIAVGDAVRVAGSGAASKVTGLLRGDRKVDAAVAEQAIIVTLADEIDASRGDVFAAPDNTPEVSDQFAAHLLWMNEHALLPGRHYWLTIGSRTIGATVTEIKHRIDVNTQEHLAAKRLEMNEIGVCNLALDGPIAFTPYAENRALGGFILVDRQSHATVGAGTVDFGLRRASNIHWQALDVNKTARAAIKHQQPRCLWFTGLSGAGKSTIANLVEKRLLAAGQHTYLLDGDNVRHGLNKDLGFTDEDRVENIRRVAEVAKLMVDAGLIVLVSFISPFREERQMARELFAPGEFVEVHVDTPIDIAEKRDVKGLYAKARAGKLKHFTGIDSPYEAPENPELRLDTTAASAEALATRIVDYLR